MTASEGFNEHLRSMLASYSPEVRDLVLDIRPFILVHGRGEALGGGPGSWPRLPGLGAPDGGDAFHHHASAGMGEHRDIRE